VDKALLDNPKVRQDITNFYAWWEKNMPGMPPPEIRVVADAEVPAQYKNAIMYTRINGIAIPQSTLDNYEEISSLRRKMVANGWLPKGTQDSSGSIFHEGGHWVQRKIISKEGQTRALFSSIVNDPDWPVVTQEGKAIDMAPDLSGNYPQMREVFKKWMSQPTIRAAIRRRVGVYASTDPEELISELFSQFVTGKHPSNLASTVGRAMIRQGRIGLAPGSVGSAL